MLWYFYLTLLITCTSIIAMSPQFPTHISEGLIILCHAADQSKVCEQDFIIQTSDNRYRCNWNQCPAEFMIKSLCFNHLYVAHQIKSDKIYQCPFSFCGLLFNTKRKGEKHYSEMHIPHRSHKRYKENNS